jgi:hypothetical protein
MRIHESFRARSLVLGSSIVLTLGIYALGLADALPVQEPCKDQQQKDLKAPKTGLKGASPGLNCVTLIESPNSCAQMPACAKSLDSNAKGAEQKVEPSQGSKLPVWAFGLLELLRILVSWPVVLALLIIYLAISRFAPYKLARILKPFRSLKLFGTEFVLSEEVGTDAEQAIEIYRKQVKRQFDTLVETNDIRAKLEDVFDETRNVIASRKPIGDLRCTLHVPDILFADTLYQLVDYYPRGGGRGRPFSSRFGIIGLCWRSREDQIQGAVPTDPQDLVRKWGMTHEEAVASGGGRQSFLALLLQDDSNTNVGILYMDAKEKDAFGADTGDTDFREKLKQTVASAAKNKGLIVSLEKTRDALKDRRPAIRIHEQ